MRSIVAMMTRANASVRIVLDAKNRKYCDVKREVLTLGESLRQSRIFANT